MVSQAGRCAAKEKVPRCHIAQNAISPLQRSMHAASTQYACARGAKKSTGSHARSVVCTTSARCVHRMRRHTCAVVSRLTGHTSAWRAVLSVALSDPALWGVHLHLLQTRFAAAGHAACIHSSMDAQPCRVTSPRHKPTGLQAVTQPLCHAQVPDLLKDLIVLCAERCHAACIPTPQDSHRLELKNLHSHSCPYQDRINSVQDAV